MLLHSTGVTTIIKCCVCETTVDRQLFRHLRTRPHMQCSISMPFRTNIYCISGFVLRLVSVAIKCGNKCKCLCYNHCSPQSSFPFPFSCTLIFISVLIHILITISYPHFVSSPLVIHLISYPYLDLRPYSYSYSYPYFLSTLLIFIPHRPLNFPYLHPPPYHRDVLVMLKIRLKMITKTLLTGAAWPTGRPGNFPVGPKDF